MWACLRACDLFPRSSDTAGFVAVRAPESCLNVLGSNLYSFSDAQDCKLFKVTQDHLIRMKNNYNSIAMVTVLKGTHASPPSGV